ncbi:MAG TPA: ROK family protein [Firmicutes bacterium]|nr:ROK family protein [Bacillota bacterium]
MGEYYLGIDLGGTKIAGLIGDEQGKIIAEKTIPTLAEEGVEPVINRIKNIILELMGEVTPGQVKGIGLCAPGPLNIKTGEVMHAPNLKWKNVQIVGILEKEFGLPVILENDANAAGYGECIYGAGKGAVNMLYMTVSTGIGGGIIANGELVYGRDYCAGEVGHMIVLPGGPLCGCGQHGCIEALASGTAIARTARKRLEDGEQSIISDLVKGDINTVTSREVAEAARQGDQLAVSLLDEAFFYLGIAIGNLINILNPETIVIGGGVAKMGDLLFDRVSRVLQDHAFPHMVKGVSIVPAVLAGRAGTMGMVALVRKRLNS